MIPFFEMAAKDALQNFLLPANSTAGRAPIDIPDLQVILRSSQLSQSLRNLTAEHVNTLIKVTNCHSFHPTIISHMCLLGAGYRHQLFSHPCQGSCDCDQMHKVPLHKGAPTAHVSPSIFSHCMRLFNSESRRSLLWLVQLSL
jgi:hypothetical protein